MPGLSWPSVPTYVFEWSGPARDCQPMSGWSPRGRGECLLRASPYRSHRPHPSKRSLVFRMRKCERKGGILFLQIWDLWGGRLGPSMSGQGIQTFRWLFFYAKPSHNHLHIRVPTHAHSLRADTSVTKICWEWPFRDGTSSWGGGRWPPQDFSLSGIFGISWGISCWHCQWRNVALAL